MGSHFSTTWYIYSREENDEWSAEPIASTLAREDDINFHLGRFKHIVFKMGVGQLKNIKKVYLYHGWRMAKAEMTDNEIRLYFRDESIAEKWWESVEECIETGVFSAEFDENWKVRDGPSNSNIVYDNITKD